MLKNIKKTVIFSFLILLTNIFPAFIHAQNLTQIRNVQFLMWADMDPYPEFASDYVDEAWYKYPIDLMHEITPFLVSGMINGWSFTYTPSDKTRNVEEFFEVTELCPSDVIEDRIIYTKPWIENNRFNCWINFKRSEAEIQNYNLWASIKHPVISGFGKEKISAGIPGIKTASENALKAAVRNYFSKEIKNKPKEISGLVLIRKEPVIGIDAGEYVVKLDFFIESVTIKEYTTF